MLQQISQALDDRQTETKALTTFSRGIVELTIFFEDGVKFFLGNSRAGIADLDAQHPVAPTASEQYFAALGILSEHLKAGCGSSVRAAVDRCGLKGCTAQRARAVLIFRVTSELVSQHIKQFANRKSHLCNTNSSGIDLIYIQQRIQHAGHRGQGLIKPRNQFLRFLSFNYFRQHALEQMQRLKRLTKVMTGSGKESGILLRWLVPPAAWPAPGRV